MAKSDPGDYEQGALGLRGNVRDGATVERDLPVPRRITSRDVARAAGVSQATVSNVLNRPELVAPATRERVQRAIDRLGFVVNDGARSLRAGRSTTIGLSVLDVSNPFWAIVTRGVTEQAAELGYMVAIGTTDESLDHEGDLLRLFEQQRAACILAAPVDTSFAQLRRMSRAGIPAVLLDAHDPEGVLPYVAGDDVGGAAQAARHLLALGHRRIGHINGPHIRYWSRARWEGVCEAVRQAGLEPDDVIRREPVAFATAQDGIRAVERILKRGDPITAIFCDNDVLAMGALHALQRNHVRVPEDISLVGYDDDEFAAMTVPPLTTVRQEPLKLGRTAARLAVDAHRGMGDASPQGETLVPRLIARASTAEPHTA